MFKERKPDKVMLADSLIPPLPTVTLTEYVIRKGDEITMRLYSNNGYNIVSVLTSTGTQGGQFQYLVRNNGYVKLPIVDSLNLAGLSIPQAEKAVEEAYFVYFNDPFVLLEVVNKRVMVFFGNSNATVIDLNQENMNLLEVLAKAGGLNNKTKSHRIKILRGDFRNPQIEYIDLSTLAGLKKANLEIKANDVIYIEPTMRVTSEVLREITPLIGILTSFLLIIELITRP